MYNTKFNTVVVDWTRVKNHCRTTDNKEFTDKEATPTFKRKLLISEHTPIRLIEVDWTWAQIPYWVSTEWSRHKFEKFISTQRDDRLKDDTPRSKKPQGALVNFDGYANMQNLIDAFRKRLCYKATPEARGLAESFKTTLSINHPELGDVLVPNCIYRGGCPEFTTCGYYAKFLDWCEKRHTDAMRLILTDINYRYKAYKDFFFDTMGFYEVSE